MSAVAPVLLEVRDLQKSYPGVRALRGVGFCVQAGQVHSLVGQNGAGKSTLIKVLAGAERSDGGSLRWRGELVDLHGHPRLSQALGISVIHQELDLFPGLSAVENMVIGRRQRRRAGLFVDWRAARAQVERVGAYLGLDFDLQRPVRELSHARQVMVAIGRALIGDARLIVMDEPTAALSDQEVLAVHRVVRSLRDDGTGVLFVSHRLDEVLALSDAITVLRQGSVVGSFSRDEIEGTSALTSLIIGAQSAPVVRRSTGETKGKALVEVKNVWLGRALKDVSLTLHAGEVVGLAGLVGSGRSELASVIFGSARPSKGEVWVGGRKFRRATPARGARLGVALLPEDRHRQAAFPTMSVRENATISSIRKYCWGPFIAPKRERRQVTAMVERFQIKVADQDAPIRQLSGGNQQKVIVARWVDCAPNVLLFDEPTQGIDVGAKMEVVRIMRQLAEAGSAVLFISSEIEEVVEFSDRIVVLREGRVVGGFDAGVGREAVLRSCYGEGQLAGTKAEAKR